MYRNGALPRADRRIVQSLVRIFAGILAIAALNAVGQLRVSAQEPALLDAGDEWRVSDADEYSLLPRSVVPQAAPRPLTGTPDTDWGQDEPAGPVSAFLQPMHGTDAVIELVLGQGRLLTTKAAIVEEGDAAVIAVGDPSVIDFEVLPNPRMIRLIGKRAGVTDLTFVTSDGESYVFEVRVLYDVELLQAQMRHAFPDALIRLNQIRDHLVLEGQARTTLQSAQIESALGAILETQAVNLRSQAQNSTIEDEEEEPVPLSIGEAGAIPAALRAGVELATRPNVSGKLPTPQIINLMTIPGVQQVLLQVRVAELDRTGMREIGADTYFEFGSGNVLGSHIGGANLTFNGIGTGTENGFAPGSSNTGFAIFPSARLEIMLRALRQNSLIRILAEPNLVALTGHEASFLAGGQFPVPVPRGTVGGAGNVTVRFKDFGVQLNFVPHIVDQEAIRLEVRPEVSTIDESLGTTLVAGGRPVPGINTRRVHTTVELREGETLALAGLLQVTLDGKTERIPGLGDLPYIGPMFSNTSHKRTEKELLVLVTPFLVDALQPDEVPSLPGDEVRDPDDIEFYLLNRIESRIGSTYRSTLSWDDPLNVEHHFKIERSNVCGPSGFTRPQY